jgi:hypothetical protein
VSWRDGYERVGCGVGRLWRGTFSCMSTTRLSGTHVTLCMGEKKGVRDDLIVVGCNFGESRLPTLLLHILESLSLPKVPYCKANREEKRREKAH